jgi:hypothetical protein
VELIHQGLRECGSLMLCGSLSSRRLDVGLNFASMAANSARSAAGSQNGLSGASINDTPPSGMRKRTGPSMRLSFAAIHSPMAAFSSGVVRISVTF